MYVIKKTKKEKRKADQPKVKPIGHLILGQTPGPLCHISICTHSTVPHQHYTQSTCKNIVSI